ncbi:hypothetical protein F5Y03DRAFT_339706 [Xylaria venustula]|nr:hypothetical protein F5Y03DRAFT_339706 [Xylaria venustula]
MPHSTFSSTSTSSDYIPRSFASGQALSYARELDISDLSPSSTSSGSTTRPLMAYSVSFTKDWKKEFSSSTGQNQERGSWSTRGNAGSNP